MDEAGRATEPSVLVVPPDSDVDPDRETVESITENGAMTSSRTRSGTSRSGSGTSKSAAETSDMDVTSGLDANSGADSIPGADGGTDAASGTSPNGASGAADDSAALRRDDGSPASYTPVPFPADGIAKQKGTGPVPAEATTADAGHASDAAAGSSRPDSDRPDGDTPDEQTPGNGRPGARLGSLTPGNGMLDTGRQAVRQAMAATNNWFARATKSDSPAQPDGNAAGVAGAGVGERPSYTPGGRRPSFTPSSGQPTAGPGQAPATSAQPATAPSAAFTGPAAPPRPSYYQGPSAFSGTPAPTGPRYPGPTPGAGPAEGAPGAPADGSPSGAAGLSSGAASAVSGAAAGIAGYASSATRAWQSRTTATKRKRTARRGAPRRQAQLTLARVEPWSVMKVSFVVSVVAFIILFVAVAVLYWVLSSLGVFTSLQHTVTTLTSSQGTAGTNILKYITASKVLGYTGMFGALNIVLITAMSTVGAVIYNLIGRTVGGIEVTFRETD